MYRNKSNPGSLGNTIMELDKIVKGTDIFNSEVLYKITKYPTYELKIHVVSVKGLTTGSLSQILYGNQKFAWLIRLFNPDVNKNSYRFEIGDHIRYVDLNLLSDYLTK